MVRTENHFTRSFYFEAPVASPLGLVPDLGGTIGASDVRFSSVSIESEEPLPVPRLAHLAANARGFPGSGATYPEDAQWIVTSAAFCFQDANHSLLALGVLLVLLSLAFRRGARLQADAEGLV